MAHNVARSRASGPSKFSEENDALLLQCESALTTYAKNIRESCDSSSSLCKMAKRKTGRGHKKFAANRKDQDPFSNPHAQSVKTRAKPQKIASEQAVYDCYVANMLHDLEIFKATGVMPVSETIREDRRPKYVARSVKKHLSWRMDDGQSESRTLGLSPVPETDDNEQDCQLERRTLSLCIDNQSSCSSITEENFVPEGKCCTLDLAPTDKLETVLSSATATEALGYATMVATLLPQCSGMLKPYLDDDDLIVCMDTLYRISTASRGMDISLAILAITRHFGLVDMLQTAASEYFSKNAALNAGEDHDVYEKFMLGLSRVDDPEDESGSDWLGSLGILSANTSAVINSPIGQRFLDFTGVMVGLGVVKRSSIELSIGDCQLFAIPEARIDQCTAGVAVDMFLKVLTKAASVFQACIAEHSLLPLAFDDQVFHKFDVSVQKVLEMAPAFSPGNIKELHGVTDHQYGEMLTAVTDLGHKITLRKMSPIARANLDGRMQRLAAVKAKYDGHYINMDGKIAAMFFLFTGGTGCGKSSLATDIATSLAEGADIPHASHNICHYNEADKYDSSMRTNKTIITIDDIGQLTKNTRGKSPSEIVLKVTGPNTEKGTMADLADKDTVVLNHFLTVASANTERLSSTYDVTHPVAIDRRIHANIMTHPHCWLSEVPGVSMLDPEKIEQWLDHHKHPQRLNSAIQDLQHFDLRVPRIGFLENGVQQHCFYESDILSKKKEPRLYEAYIMSLRRQLRQMDIATVIFGTNPFLRKDRKVVEGKLKEVRDSDVCVADRADIHFLVFWGITRLRSFLERERKRMDSRREHQAGSRMCMQCQLLRAACVCKPGLDASGVTRMKSGKVKLPSIDELRAASEITASTTFDDVVSDLELIAQRKSESRKAAVSRAAWFNDQKERVRSFGHRVREYHQRGLTSLLLPCERRMQELVGVDMASPLTMVRDSIADFFVTTIDAHLRAQMRRRAAKWFVTWPSIGIMLVVSVVCAMDRHKRHSSGIATLLTFLLSGPVFSLTFATLTYKVICKRMEELAASRRESRVPVAMPYVKTVSFTMAVAAFSIFLRSRKTRVNGSLDGAGSSAPVEYQAVEVEEDVPLPTVATMAKEDFLRVVKKNQGKIMFKTADDEMYYTNYFSPGGNEYMCPKHVLLRKPTHFRLQRAKGNPQTWQELARVPTATLEGRDILMIRCTNAGVNADLTDLFQSKVTPTKNGISILSFPYSSKRQDALTSYSTGCKPPKYDVIATAVDTGRHDFVHVPSPAKIIASGGDCFALLCDTSGKNRKIVAANFASYPHKQGRDVLLEPITRDDIHALRSQFGDVCEIDASPYLNLGTIKKQRDVVPAMPHYKAAVHFLKEGGVTVLGSVPKIDTPGCKVEPTYGGKMVAEAFGIPDGHYRGATFIRNAKGEKVYPMNTALSQICISEARYADEVMPAIIEDYLGPILPRLRERKRGVLTPDEIVFGTGKNLGGLKFSTSMGFPESCDKKRFSHFVDGRRTFLPEVWDDINEIDAMLRLGQRCPMPFKAGLKAEVLTREKARVYMISQAHLSVLTRKYLGPLMEFFHADTDNTECAAGIAAVSDGWDATFKRFEKYDGVVCFDYKKFDQKVTPRMKSTVSYVIMKMLETMDYYAEDLRAAATLLSEYIEPLVAFDGAFIHLLESMPSGWGWTTGGNCQDNSLRVRSAVYLITGRTDFRAFCDLVVYGDDATLASSDPRVTFHSLQYAMSQLGIVITGTEKDNEVQDARTPLRKSTFLSRAHVWHPRLGVHLGALLDDSLYKGISMRVVNRSVSAQEHFISAVRCFLYELFAHGERRYEDERATMTYICCQLGLLVAIPELMLSYEDRVMDYVGKEVEADMGLDITFDCSSQPAPQEGRFAKECRAALITATPFTHEGNGRLQSRRDITKDAGSFQDRVHSAIGTEMDAWHESARESIDKNRRLTITLTSSANSGADHQATVKFQDASPGWSVHLGDSYDVTRQGNDLSDMSLANFLERAVKIYSEDWTPQVGDVTFDPWKILMNNRYVREKLSGYRNGKMRLRIKILVNGSKFHQGERRVVYDPFVDDAYPFVPGQSANARARSTMLPHVNINPTLNLGGEIVAPFFYDQDALDLTTTDVTRLGRLHLFTTAPLEMVNDGVPRVTITMFANFEDVELAVPTGAPLATLDMGEIVEGPLTRNLHMVARFADLLHNVPGIGAFAKATSLVAGGASEVAARYGFSSPPMMPSTGRVFQSLGDSNCTAHQQSTALSLSYDPKSETTIDPRTTGISSADELAFGNIMSRSCYFATVEWPNTAIVGDELASYDVSPMLAPVFSTVGLKKEYVQTPLSFVAAPFKYWRGTVSIRVRVIASAMHSGRLRISHDGVGHSAESPYNTSRNLIVDITEERDFVINVGWASEKPYLEVSDIQTLLSPSRGNPDEFNGALRFGVESNLVGPDTTVTGISLQLSVHSDDMEFWGPSLEKLEGFDREPDRAKVNETTSVPNYSDDFVSGTFGRTLTPVSGTSNAPPTRVLIAQDPLPVVVNQPPAGPVPVVVTNDPQPPPVVTTSNSILPLMTGLDLRALETVSDRWVFPREGNNVPSTFTLYANLADNTKFDLIMSNRALKGTITTLGTPEVTVNFNENAVARTVRWNNTIRPSWLPTELSYTRQNFYLISAETDFDLLGNVEYGYADFQELSELFNLPVLENNAVTGQSSTRRGDWHVQFERNFDINRLPGRVPDTPAVLAYHGNYNGQVVEMTPFISSTLGSNWPTALITGDLVGTSPLVRGIVYVKEGATLDAGEMEGGLEEGDQGPEPTDVGMELHSVATPAHLHSIFYADPIVSFRTMLKRQELHGMLNIAEGSAIQQRAMYPRDVPFAQKPTNASATMFQYVTAAYKGMRGGMRKKLVPIRTGYETMMLSRDTLPDGSITTDTSITTYGMNVGTSGAEIFPANTVGHIQVPYHVPLRFIPARRRGISGLENKYKLGYSVGMAAGRETVLAEFSSIAEDFNVFLFVGPPPIYL